MSSESEVFSESVRPGYVPCQAPVRAMRAVRRDIAEAAYVEYANRYGTSQSFDRLHERGGFGIAELLDLLVASESARG